MKVLLVDDEKVILTVSREALRETAATIVTHTDPIEALEEDLESFDIILSDFYMPGLRGDEFLHKVKERAPAVPFIFLTQNDDLGIAVELIRHGADDYISKPIAPKTFVFRINKIIAEKERERQIQQILDEQRLLDLENRKLSNWRLLYASKDARQTETLVANLARNINQGGGFLWLDMLESSYTAADEAHYTVPKAILDMALTSARNQQRLLERVEFIGNLDSTEFEMESLSTEEFHRYLSDTINERLVPLTTAHERTFDLALIDFSEETASRRTVEGRSVQIDRGGFADVLYELVVNAIKYSPEHLPEEEWTDGTGLYIARKIMKRFGGWISASSGVDYTWKQPQPLVRIDIRVPMVGTDDDADA